MASEANTTSSVNLLHRPLGDVLDALASQHELAGGGGPAAALTAAAAAALTAKVARASRGTWSCSQGAIAHAESLRAQIQALGRPDAEAYREASAMLMQSERSAQHGVVAPAKLALAADERERLLDDWINAIEAYCSDRMLPFVVQRGNGGAIVRPPAD